MGHLGDFYTRTDMKKLSDRIESLENTIKKLEERLATLEAVSFEIDPNRVIG